MACTSAPAATFPTNSPTANASTSPTAAPIPTPSPASTPEPTPTPSPAPPTPLEQSLQDWLSGVTPLKWARWVDPGGHGQVPLGLILNVASDTDWPYGGYLLGAKPDINGHFIVFVGFEDGSFQQRYYVPFRVWERMLVKETTNLDFWIEDGPIVGSNVFYDKILDGTYLGRLILFNQPFDADYYKGTLLPQNFPGLIEAFTRSLPAATALHEFAAGALQHDLVATPGRPAFIDALPTDLIDARELPIFFEVKVNVTP